MPYLLIDPSEKLDYTCDWGDFVDDGGSPSDTITSSAWKIEGGGSPTPVLSGSTSTVDTTTTFIEGCERGQMYRLTNTITTAMGRTVERSIDLRCGHR
jgi:hypothetical protein